MQGQLQADEGDYEVTQDLWQSVWEEDFLPVATHLISLLRDT